MEEITSFASAQRSSMEQIYKEFEFIDSQKFFSEIFSAMTGVGAIVDYNRQVVFANDEFLEKLGIDSIESILGKRPGEIVNCIHSDENPSGCGTTAACAYCGAVNSILESQKTGTRATCETRISTVSDGKTKSLDLTVTTTPINISGNKFYVLILQDIGDEKRRFALERIFFHDILNTAGGLNGLLTILKEGTDPEEARELINMSEEASRNLLEEIMLHRQIRAAENGELQVKNEKMTTIGVLTSAIDLIRFHEIAKTKTIQLDSNSASTLLETDRILLQRILINLLKNAIEATEAGGTVNAGVTTINDKVRFWVKNISVMPEEVQLQIFQRSFSTKGSGRGIGTYSIRLLAENYLNGKVSFISNEKDGTIFSLELNKFHTGE